MMIKIKLIYCLPVCLIIGLILLNVDAHETKRLRHVLARSRSHPQDVFRDQFLAMHGTDRPFRTRKPHAAVGFKINHSNQQLTSGASINMRPYSNPEEDSSQRDYSDINDYEMNWDSEKDGSNFQQDRNFIPPRDTRMWPGANLMGMNYPIVCQCETNLGGIYISHSNQIQPQPVPSYQPPPTHPVFNNQKPESGLPHYPIRSQPPRMYPKENHYNHIDFRGPSTEKNRAPEMNNPVFATIRPTSTAVTPPTNDESPNAVIRVLS